MFHYVPIKILMPSTQEPRPTNEQQRQARKDAQDNLTTELLPSKTGGICWVFGLLSIPLLLLPPAAIITGFCSIVFGHIAKYKIRKHPEVGGANVATLGLLMGYLCFLFGLMLIPSMRMQATAMHGWFNSYRGVVVGETNGFADAEKELLRSAGLFFGNNEDASEIANQLQVTLNTSRKEDFRGASAIAIKAMTRVKSGEGVCNIVLVPDFSDFTLDARQAILNLAWKESQRKAFGKCEPGEKFAVAVRDRIRYHSMEFGRATKSPDRIAQPDSSLVDETLLEPWFE